MNIKQFISSAVFAGVDFGISKIPVLGKFVAFPFRVVFPTMGYERVNSTHMRRDVLFSIFLLGFTVCFLLQAILAYQAGYLGEFDLEFGPNPDPRGGPDRVMFFDDGHNLFNFALLVPLYLVAGAGYIISLFSLKERMRPADLNNGFELDDDIKPFLSGMVAISVLILILILAQAGYATDIQNNSEHLFWFHGETQGSRFQFNGYAYLVINTCLAAFVIFVALLHLELFRWSSILSKAIRGYDPEKDRDQIFMDDGDRVKALFAPFTETAIWSKAFAMLLAINIYTWKASGVAGGIVEDVDDNSWFLRLVFVLYIVIVIWIVSLPRYRVQYELFKLRHRQGVHEYFDIRMPWTIGWSVFIDVLLFFFFSTMIFRDNDIVSLIISLFKSG